MNKRIEKILNKVLETKFYEVKILEKKNLSTENDANEELENYIYIRGLKLMLRYNVPQKLETWLYLKSRIILERLSDVVISTDNLIIFVNWYINGFKSFYLNFAII